MIYEISLWGYIIPINIFSINDYNDNEYGLSFKDTKNIY